MMLLQRLPPSGKGKDRNDLVRMLKVIRHAIFAGKVYDMLAAKKFADALSLLRRYPKYAEFWSYHLFAGESLLEMGEEGEARGHFDRMIEILSRPPFSKDERLHAITYLFKKYGHRAKDGIVSDYSENDLKRSWSVSRNFDAYMPLDRQLDSA